MGGELAGNLIKQESKGKADVIVGVVIPDGTGGWFCAMNSWHVFGRISAVTCKSIGLTEMKLEILKTTNNQ